MFVIASMENVNYNVAAMNGITKSFVDLGFVVFHSPNSIDCCGMLIIDITQEAKCQIFL